MYKRLLFPMAICCLLISQTGCSKTGHTSSADTDSIEDFMCPCCGIEEDDVVVDEPIVESVDSLVK